jgi:hypothetical protein
LPVVYPQRNVPQARFGDRHVEPEQKRCACQVLQF